MSDKAGRICSERHSLAACFYPKRSRRFVPVLSVVRPLVVYLPRRLFLVRSTLRQRVGSNWSKMQRCTLWIETENKMCRVFLDILLEIKFPKIVKLFNKSNIIGTITT